MTTFQFVRLSECMGSMTAVNDGFIQKHFDCWYRVNLFVWFIVDKIIPLGGFQAI